MNLIVRLALVLLLTGFSLASFPVDHKRIPAGEAQSIAEAEVIKRESWRHWTTESAHLDDDGNWQIVIWRLPKVPGGFRVVFVDPSGNVLHYQIGQ
jgi:hypothetical protein